MKTDEKFSLGSKLKGFIVMRLSYELMDSQSSWLNSDQPGKVHSTN
jgi:hypothetical protein